jgi:uncharacterized delta-60 repeat protein
MNILIAAAGVLVMATLILLYTVVESMAVTDVWTVVLDGPENGWDEGYAVEAGLDGSVYFIGTTDGVNPGDDILVGKYTSAGSQAWIRTIDGKSGNHDYGADIAVGPSGNIHVVGSTYVRRTYNNIWTSKYSPDGAVLWTKKYNRPGPKVAEMAYGVAVAPGGAVYVTGYSNNLTGGSDMVLLKYSRDGVKKWARFYSPAHYGHGVAVGPSGKIYVTGNQPVGGHASVMFAKYSPKGRLILAKGYRCPNSNTCSGYAIAVDSKERVYITGAVSGSSLVGDIWVGRFSRRGSLRWEKRINGNANKDEYGYGITVDSADRVYVAGHIRERGQRDNVWLRAYNPNGSKIWTEKYHNFSEAGRDVAVAADGGIYVVGSMSNDKTTFFDILLRKYQETP